MVDIYGGYVYIYIYLENIVYIYIVDMCIC